MGQRQICPLRQVRRTAQYLKRQELVVLHANPRHLLVPVRHPLLHRLIVVSHAPQSGCARQQRQRADWWTALSESVDQYRQPGEHVFLLLDANAASGPRDVPHVGFGDDQETASTSTS